MESQKIALTNEEKYTLDEYFVAMERAQTDWNAALQTVLRIAGRRDGVDISPNNRYNLSPERNAFYLTVQSPTT